MILLLILPKKLSGEYRVFRQSLILLSQVSNICPICGNPSGPGQIFTENNHHLLIDFAKSLDSRLANPKVFEGKICGKEEPMAVKLLLLESPEKENSFENECQIMRTFAKRDNFVHYHDYAISKSQQRGYLVMEKCQATLQDVIYKKFPLPKEDGKTDEEMMISLMRQILHAMASLFNGASPVVHRDLKPDNIFLQRKPREGVWLAKIGDFGLSKVFEESSSLSTHHWGHLNFAAPELLRCINDGTEISFSPAQWHAIDIFALGCCFAQLLMGKHIFGVCR